MSFYDTLDNVNLCEKKTGFEKARILLTLGFYPTQKSCLEAFEKKPHLTEKTSLKSCVLFCDLEQKSDNEAVSLSNNVTDSMSRSGIIGSSAIYLHQVK